MAVVKYYPVPASFDWWVFTLEETVYAVWDFNGFGSLAFVADD